MALSCRMTKRALHLAFAVVLLPALATPLLADSGTNETSKGDAKVFDEPAPIVTSHTVTVGGKTLKYHTTAGYIVLKEEEGKPLVKSPDQKPVPEEKGQAEKTKDGLKPKAKVFFVAYTLDESGEPSSRPVTFAFNGGPGSSSVWLHMGAVAPRRANLTDEGEAPAPPYQLVDNESTWLDRTDLAGGPPVSSRVDYAAVQRYKQPRLETACRNFFAGGGSAEFEEFRRVEAAWLHPFVRFLALKEANGRSPGPTGPGPANPIRIASASTNLCNGCSRGSSTVFGRPDAPAGSA